jgi:hypothetical protein
MCLETSFSTASVGRPSRSSAVLKSLRKATLRGGTGLSKRPSRDLTCTSPSVPDGRFVVVSRQLLVFIGRHHGVAVNGRCPPRPWREGGVPARAGRSERSGRTRVAVYRGLGRCEHLPPRTLVAGLASPLPTRGRLARATVLGDVAEEAVFNLVPLGGARRKVRHTDGEPSSIGEPLQFDLPEPRAVAVAAATVSRDEQAGRFSVSPFLPMFRHQRAMGSTANSGRVVVHPDADPRGVEANVVDPVRDGLPKVLVEEVMDTHWNRVSFGLPLAPSVLEITWACPRSERPAGQSRSRRHPEFVQASRLGTPTTVTHATSATRPTRLYPTRLLNDEQRARTVPLACFRGSATRGSEAWDDLRSATI